MGVNQIIKSSETITDSVMYMTKLWADCRSKDPSSKVGSCIYDRDTGGMYFGYNGFPKGITDYADNWNCRDETKGFTKYEFVVHAEMNAVMKALKSNVDLSRCILFCTHHPCERCMKDIIATNGIKMVYYENDKYASFTDRSRAICKSIAMKLKINLIKWEGEQYDPERI